MVDTVETFVAESVFRLDHLKLDACSVQRKASARGLKTSFHFELNHLQSGGLIVHFFHFFDVDKLLIYTIFKFTILCN